METNPFGKAPATQTTSWGRRGGKVLTKTTVSERAGISTRITSTMVNMQMKTTFFKEMPTLIPREKS